MIKQYYVGILHYEDCVRVEDIDTFETLRQAEGFAGVLSLHDFVVSVGQQGAEDRREVLTLDDARAAYPDLVEAYIAKCSYGTLSQRGPMASGLRPLCEACGEQANAPGLCRRCARKSLTLQ